jgi:hypothetical protein
MGFGDSVANPITWLLTNFWNGLELPVVKVALVSPKVVKLIPSFIPPTYVSYVWYISMMVHR